MTYGDGESLGGKYYELNRFFSAYYATEYGISDSYRVDWIVNGTQQTWEGKGISKTEIEKTYPASQDPFSFKKVNDRTAVLKIDRFFSMKGEPDLKKFFKSSFTTLSEEGISNLILDLRGNERGNEKLGIELYKYLALKPFHYYRYLSTRPNSSVDFDHHTSKIFRIANSFSKEKDGIYQFVKGSGLKLEEPHPLAFKGKVVLLLDGQSFSVTTEFASKAQSDQRVFIIGEETAGGAEGNSSGFFSIVTLPHSKIDLGIPRIGFHMADLGENIDQNRGILPDEEIRPSALVILHQKDPVMERALQLSEK
ncbi:S41 family peptidase [Algoriphagus sp. SE2]|uniref:S41 family peptidase n=1 Tax=Algoriphagus sp. SE2 TaxID=3141536 RepID=UPI0031CD87C2